MTASRTCWARRLAVALAGGSLHPGGRCAARKWGRRRAADQRLPQHRCARGRAAPRAGRGGGDRRGLSASRQRPWSTSGSAAGDRGVGDRGAARAPLPSLRDRRRRPHAPMRRSCHRPARTRRPSSRTFALFAPSVLDRCLMPELTLRLEQLIRSYDPCISCATHYLDLTIERAEVREGRVVLWCAASRCAATTASPGRPGRAVAGDAEPDRRPRSGAAHAGRPLRPG